MIYKYRVLKSAWGVAIDINAEIIPLENKLDAIPVCDRIYLQTQDISSEDLAYLHTGIKMFAPLLQPILTATVVISVIELSYNFCDFQPEGLAYAMAGWLAQYFQLNYEFPPVVFDKTQNRYHFTLP